MPVGFLDHPKWLHFLMITKFFIFKFLLSATDVLTDILTAVQFFYDGDFYWCLCTSTLLFAPFSARVIQAFVRVIMCIRVDHNFCIPVCRMNSVRLQILMQELPNLMWSFPLLQPIRSVPGCSWPPYHEP